MYKKEGDLSFNVMWSVPRPTCGGRLQSTPQKRPGETFEPGVYKMDYLYQTPHRTDITCTVRFEVKGMKCNWTNFYQGRPLFYHIN